MAMGGVKLADALRRAANHRAPTMMPTVLLRLYSTAGASASCQLDPEFASKG